MENLNQTNILVILIYLALQTLFNLAARILLVIGSFIAARKVSKWYGLCLAIGSIMFVLCYLPSAPIFSLILTRNISIRQYAGFSMAIGALTDLALFVFGIGFIGLSRQLNRSYSGR